MYISYARNFFEALAISVLQVICITQTWLTHIISRNEYFTDKNKVLRCDRHSTQPRSTLGGGVLNAVQKLLPCFRWFDLQEGN